jgi:hypothetical protein
MADDDAIDGERNRARHNGTALQCRAAGAVLVDGDAERGERDRGCSAEKDREALGAQNAPSRAKAETTTPR